MKRTHLFEVLLLSLWACLWNQSIAIAIGPTPPTWEPRELISTITDIGDHSQTDRYLAYDHHGNPGVAYADSGGTAVQLGRRVPGFGWVSEWASVGSGFTDYQNPSLVFNRHERPVISAIGDNISVLMLIRNANQSGYVSSHLQQTGSISSTSISADLYGTPTIAFSTVALSNEAIFVVADENNNTIITDEFSDLVAGVGEDAPEHLSLTFDSINRPFIAYHNTTEGELHLATSTGGPSWFTTVVDDTATQSGLAPSLAIDPTTGYPSIAYHNVEGVSQTLRYASWNGTSWDLEIIANFATNASLAFDPADGHPAIAYQDTFTESLRLAWYDGTSWQTQEVDGVGATGYHPSLAFNDFGDGFPSIAYFEENGVNDNLWFIHDPIVSVPEPRSIILMGLLALSWLGYRVRAGANSFSSIEFL